MWPFIIAAASTLMEMDAKNKAAWAERRAGQEDISSALIAGSFRGRKISERRDRTLSSIRARAGASGVELAGSSLEVFLHSAAQAERDLIISRIVTEREIAAGRQRMGGAGAMADAAVTGGILEMASHAVRYRTREGLSYQESSPEPEVSELSKPTALAVPDDWKW